MTRSQLIEQIKSKRSFLCVGLDTDPEKIPGFLHKFPDPAFEFNKRIIDATAPFAVAYKINTAFYEINGARGWETMQKTLQYIPAGIFTIADAKRGDIGNTSRYYARAFFRNMNFDAITIAPYMGEDSVKPFLTPGKWAVVLGLTSNAGALDFQQRELAGGVKLFAEVIRKAAGWGTPENMMFVAGATRGEMLEKVRKIIPDHFLLVPGVGAQGGSLETVCRYAMNDECGLLVNSSRGIIYAGRGKGFETEVEAAARRLQEQMGQILDSRRIA